ncbi:MAG TPA: zinc-ribbon domain-containing protein, partial [Candidatus Enterococcus stercoravium]|nr:zinc-ribbon domain-containing protein [Candidatus Enterococcus stercoravium]
MNNCPNCGAQVPEEAQFCPACGHELPAAENRGALAEEQTKVLTDAASQGAVDGNPTGSRRESNLIESHSANDQLVEGIPADSTPIDNNLAGDSPNAGNPNVGNPAENIPTASQAADEELAPVAAKEETDVHQQTEEDEQAMGNAPASHLEGGEMGGSQPDSDSNSDLDSDLDATATVAPAQKPEPAPIPETASSATTAQKKNSSGPTFSETSSPEEELLTAATKTKAYASGYFQWLHGNLKAPRLNQHQGPLSY